MSDWAQIQLRLPFLFIVKDGTLLSFEKVNNPLTPRRERLPASAPHHVAGSFIFKVILASVRHLSCLYLSCSLHLLSSGVVFGITMETITHLLLFPLHLWQKTTQTVRGRCQNKTVFFLFFFFQFYRSNISKLVCLFVCVSLFNTLNYANTFCLFQLIYWQALLHQTGSALPLCCFSPFSERCCLSIFSSLPSSESIFVLICDSSFLMVRSWSVFTVSTHT